MEIEHKPVFIMLTNYFLTAFRNIIRHKAFSLIVVLGLTIGVAVFGFVFQYVNNELYTDRFNEHFSTIYRLEHGDWALNGTALGPEIAQQFPEVVSSTRISCWEGAGATIKTGADLMKLDNMIYADSGFFTIFSFRFIRGDPYHAIDMPNSVVLTESTARKIFGDEDPINKSFKVNNKVDFTVTGVIKDVQRFHIKIDAVASFISLKGIYDRPDFLTQYGTWNYYTYFNLKENCDPLALTGKINAFYAKRPEWNFTKETFLLRPLAEIYFTRVKIDYTQAKANRPMLFFYLLIAAVILAIACVNFINLTIARSATRSKEIGVRKVMGAKRKNLITQFLGESIIYALLATELSLILMDIMQPGFNNLVQRQLGLGTISRNWILFFILVLPLIIGALAGIYPALYLTRFKPVITLKSEKTRGKGSLFFRRALIVGQFTISIVLIIATLTVRKQLTFLHKSDLGFSKDNIINIGMNGSLRQHQDLFRSMILNDPRVKGISFSTQSLDNVTSQSSIEIGIERKQFTHMCIDTGFIPLMDIKIKDGRNFRPDTPSDSNKVILNEEAAKYFGLKEPVAGQTLGTGEQQYEILAVVKDFHYNSLRNPIGPLIMMLQPQWISVANIKVDAQDLPRTINHLRKTWNAISPEFLFEFRFLDKSYEQLYLNELRISKLCLYLAILAIFIATIGLMGLSSFLAAQRIKEIGIRKATGDTTTGIVRLFASEFMKWVVLSGLIAIPVAYFMMNSWLIGSCLIAILIAFITVVSQTYKIASRNPVEALRYE